MHHRFVFANLIALCLACAACAHSATKSASSSDTGVDKASAAQKEASNAQSLKEDRQQLNEVRLEIPAEKQKSGDELSQFLQLMHQGTEQPQMVRDKFNVLNAKSRASFREKIQKLRETFRKEDADRVKDFTDKQKTTRANFVAGKHSPGELHDFFQKQEKIRQAFYTEEHVRHAKSEVEITAQSKDFDKYMRGKTGEFNEQFRLYSKKFSERPKEKKAVTGETTDFQGLDQVPAKTLGTED